MLDYEKLRVDIKTKSFAIGRLTLIKLLKSRSRLKFSHEIIKSTSSDSPTRVIQVIH